MIRVADYIIGKLVNEGLAHVFMVTGRGILYLTDAVARNKMIKGISVHHEQAAAYAATTYAQSTDNIGAAIVSTGCAGTNAITGVLCAWQDNVPCIFISGQNMLKETVRYTKIPLRTFGSQETDIISIVEPITKYATMIEDPAMIAYELEKAIHLAREGRKGPVWIDIPLDIQDARIEEESLKHYVCTSISDFKPKQQDVDYVLDQFKIAERPIVLLGSGIRSADAIGELEIFIDQTSIPVVYSSSAVDVYGASNPLSLGTVVSMGGPRSGNFAVQNADFVLALGCRLSPFTTSSEYDKFVRDGKLVVIDIDAIEHSKNTVSIDRLIIADVKMFLNELISQNVSRAKDQWLKKCLHWKEIFFKCEDRFKTKEKTDLYHLSECLSDVLPDNATLCTDAGLEELVVPSNVRFKKGQRCIHPVSQGAMGYALPGAFGIGMASVNPVVAVIGDGSIMMNLQELQTIKYHNVPLKIIVVNNNGYSVIRKRQKDLFRTRTIGNDPTDGVGYPDFQKVAECFEFTYIKIENSVNLKKKLESIFKINGPVLCELMGVENQCYIHSSFAKNSEKRLVKRPLEDQSPFLDRDLFLSEMVIEPIDQ